MRLYVSGRVSGNEQYFQEFAEEADELRRNGHWVLNPVEMDSAEWGVERSWSGYLARDLAALENANLDGIVLLNGWVRSPGSRLEASYALERGLGVYRAGTLLWMSPDHVRLLIEKQERQEEAQREDRAPAASDAHAAYQFVLNPPTSADSGTEAIRTFSTGANRDVSAHKHDYEGFLSPRVIRAFGDYMHRNRFMRDGTTRASDNWQSGIPLDVYLKSAFRHFMDWWSLHRGLPTADFEGNPAVLEDSLCALLFNLQGYLDVTLREREATEMDPTLDDRPKDSETV